MRIDVSRFGWEHMFVEPFHQLQIIGHSAEAGHRRVCVAVDKAGHDQRILRIDDLLCVIFGAEFFFCADFDDFRCMNGDTGVSQGSVTAVH